MIVQPSEGAGVRIEEEDQVAFDPPLEALPSPDLAREVGRTARRRRHTRGLGGWSRRDGVECEQGEGAGADQRAPGTASSAASGTEVQSASASSHSISRAPKAGAVGSRGTSHRRR